MQKTHCAIIAVLGPPNAGKSTLVNNLAGGKISIVTPKPQTTRLRVRGICAAGQTQLILTDTPGIFESANAFEQGMVREAWAGVADADAIVLMLDATRGLDETVQGIIEKLRGGNLPLACILNKVDAVKKPYLLALAEACNAYGVFEQIFMISATTGNGVDAVKAWMAEKAPEGPWLYPEEDLTDQSLRQIAAELTREQLFLMLRQELPYSVAVETELWEEKETGPVRIMQTIFVEREGQKKIVIGAGGVMLKNVGTRARKAIGELIGRPVRLELFVKVNARWKESGQQ